MSASEKDEMTTVTVAQAMPEIPLGKLRTAIDAALPTVRKELAPSTPSTFGRTPPAA
jgi:hypothetical protein